MATKQQVIDLHKKNPDWSAGKLAAALNCGNAYIRKTASRYRLDIPYSKTYMVEELRDRARTLKATAARYEKRAKALEDKHER